MTIRLTSPEAFDKVLEKLKQDPMYDEEVNAPFFKYCVDDIRNGIARGDYEWYLNIDWLYDNNFGKMVLVIRYSNNSDIQTDIEYLTDKLNEK